MKKRLAQFGEYLVKKYSKKELYDPKKEALYDHSVYSLYEKEILKPVKKDLTIHDLVREQMGLLTFVDTNGWPEDRTREFYKGCYDLNRNENLQVIISQYTKLQQNKVWLEGQQDTDYIDCKLVVSGVLGVADAIRKGAAQHGVEEEEFDQYEAA